MTLRDLLENGGGTVYVVNSNDPTTVTEFDCIFVSGDDFKQRFPRYNHYLNYYHNYEYVIARKSKAKNCILYDGTPKFVSITNSALFIFPTQANLDNTRFMFYRAILFTSKEDACNYAIEKIKEKKMKLNSMITKINKFKFDVVG
jgi:hypothetical protein